MGEPRADKVAVVQEVRGRLEAAAATVITEYRGLDVAAIAALRQSLADAGSDYKVFKNTLVRRAVDGSGHQALGELLVGPTAIAFVHDDVSAVAKALRDFARGNPALVVKGGMLEGNLLGPRDLAQLADLPSRDVLLARMAGAIAAPLQQLAGLVQALPRNLAFGLAALVEERGGVPGAAPPEGGSGPEAAGKPEAAGTAEAGAEGTGSSEEAGEQAVAPQGEEGTTAPSGPQASD